LDTLVIYTIFTAIIIVGACIYVVLHSSGVKPKPAKRGPSFTEARNTADMSDYDTEIDWLISEIALKDDKILHLNKELQSKDTRLSSMENEIATLKDEIQELKEKNRSIADEKHDLTNEILYRCNDIVALMGKCNIKDNEIKALRDKMSA